MNNDKNINELPKEAQKTIESLRQAKNGRTRPIEEVKE